jgi:hypothetical protein
VSPGRVQPDLVIDSGTSTARPRPAEDRSAPHVTDDAINGQLLTIGDLQQLSPDEREVVRRSDEAFMVRQTWARWKMVRAGLVVLRDLAMREAGSKTIISSRSLTSRSER